MAKRKCALAKCGADLSDKSRRSYIFDSMHEKAFCTYEERCAWVDAQQAIEDKYRIERGEAVQDGNS